MKKTAQILRHVSLAVIFIAVAALVFPKNTWAAAGAQISCQPSSNCTVGEYLFDDSYNPITSATCTITSYYPNNSTFLNAVSLSPTATGWYADTFTAPATLGLYPTVITCVTGGQTMRIDKSFTVGTVSSLSSSDVTNAVWDTQRASHATSGTFGQTLQNTVASTSDIAAAVWNYSGRTLTSFGTLVVGIWNNTTGSQTRDLVEQIVNKPVTKTVLENGTQVSNSLQSKIDSTNKLSTRLLTNAQYVRSKAGIIKDQWASLKQPEISQQVSKLSSLFGQKNDNSFEDSIFSEINWLATAWNWNSVANVSSKTTLAKANLDSLQQEIDNNGKTTTAYKDLEALIATTTKLQSSIGVASDSSQKATLFADVAGTKQFISALDAKARNADNMLTAIEDTSSKGSNPSGVNGVSFTTLLKNIDKLTADVLSINKVPAMGVSYFNNLYPALSLRGAKNKVLGLKGVIDANKYLLAFQANKAFASTWLEEGSIIFKTLITNPSKIINQDAPVKYYLPAEVKKENIIKIDNGLTVGYDTDQNQYYVTGNFNLSPDETKTVSVEVDDSIYTISQITIDGLRKQVTDLSKPLQNTSYFAQGVTISSDVNVSLDKVEALMKTANTPDSKIANYREAMIQMKAINSERDQLKGLVTSAGSVGTLFGFVGGSQVLAVWGMIIIMVAGFVFLALYMKLLRNNEKGKPSILAERGDKKEKEVKQGLNKLRPSIKFALGVIFLALVGSFVSGAILTKNILADKKIGPSTQSIAKKQDNVPQEKVLGTTAPLETVKIFVPTQSVVNIYSKADINSGVVASITSSKDVAKKDEKSGWVKVALLSQDGTPSQIEGWVDKDFIQNGSTTPDASQNSNSTQGFVVVNSDISSYLKVRASASASSDEVARIYAGEKYSLVSKADHWFQIKLNDGTLGFISKDFSHTE